MAEDRTRWTRQGEAFWRAHQEAWKRSELNQREYCEAQGIPLKAFGNWRAKFKAEPEPSGRKLLYRRGGVSHRLRARSTAQLPRRLGTVGRRRIAGTYRNTARCPITAVHVAPRRQPVQESAGPTRAS